MARSEEPDEASVQMLMSLVPTFSRSEAIARLKGNDLDLNRAAEEYYAEPEGSSKYKWDDSVWSADREGTGNAAGVQFNVQGPDLTTSHFDTTSAAPTRPPSRTNNRSPLGAPTTQADEDADLQRALAESAAESGLPPQESGIIGGDVNETKFGPATRSEYEQGQWALVPTKAEATTQQKLELQPFERKRAPTAPAFLRATKEHRLAAIITILSQIPLAKSAMLSCGSPARSYGYSSEWWQGKPIVKQQNLEAANQSANGTYSQQHPDFHDELHRLVAFLDSTDRAYGSADGLADTDAIDPEHGYGWGNNDIEESFFAVLKGEYEATGNPALKSFTGVARTERVLKATAEETPVACEDTSMPHRADSDSGDEVLFNFLTIPLQEGQSQWVTSLYNALDTIFWSDAFSKDKFPDDSSNMAFFGEIGETLAIRIGGDGLCKPCDIPLTLYLDRYMESRKDLAISTQTHIHTLRDALSRIGEREKRILTCSGENGCHERKWFDGKPHSARDCWGKTMEASKGLIDRQCKLAQLRYTQNALADGKELSMKDIALIHTGKSRYELTQEEQEVKEILDRGIELAQWKLADIDLGLEYINERRQQFLEALEHLSMRLTVRENEAPQDFADKYIVPDQPQYYKPEYWNPSYGYLLRGVATTNEITYVCTRREVDLIEIGEQSEPREQWWRLVYAAGERNPLSVEKTDAESVSIAAGSESKYPILIYASEAALEGNPVQLSDALRTFVRADNKVFQNELAKGSDLAEDQIMDTSQNAAPQGGDGPTPLTAEAIKAIAPAPWASSSKRKHSAASSVATIDSTDSRGMDMSFSDPAGPLADHDDGTRNTWHHEFASPTPQPNKMGGLVESLEKCRTVEPESPVLGRRSLRDQEMTGLTNSTVKAPEMQERTGGPSPFVMNRPVETASQAAANSVHLMDMEMDVDAEHHGS
ncbi:ubiquitin interaction motif protein [Seiridium cupressi]